MEKVTMKRPSLPRISILLKKDLGCIPSIKKSIETIVLMLFCI